MEGFWFVCHTSASSSCLHALVYVSCFVYLLSLFSGLFTYIPFSEVGAVCLLLGYSTIIPVGHFALDSILRRVVPAVHFFHWSNVKHFKHIILCSSVAPTSKTKRNTTCKHAHLRKGTKSLEGRHSRYYRMDGMVWIISH